VSKNSIKPQNTPETLIWYYIIGTYPLYLLGAQYVLAPFLASYLVFILLKKWWNQTEETPDHERISISLSAWIWIFAMLAIELALLVAHLNFNLGIPQILKSSLMWYRNWGLLALFPLAGHLNIRPSLIYRAVCILCFQSFFLTIIASLALILHIPPLNYTSSLKAFGGVIQSYRVILFYMLDHGEPRLQLFAPWPPALGMVGDIYFCLVLQERDKKWRWFGIVGSVAMIFASVSRLAIMCLLIIPGSVWLLTNFLRPRVQFALGFVSLISGMFFPTVINFLDTLKERFDKARSSSSKTRAILRNMARERWLSDAPIWGHGRIEAKGPAIVGKIPIGSHHTWFGILYAQGLVGCIALAVALLWSFIDLLIKAQTNENAKVGLRIVLVIILFTFAENIEALAYIYWPGLIILGNAFKEEELSVYQTTEQFES
jgi:hypothetical protein